MAFIKKYGHRFKAYIMTNYLPEEKKWKVKYFRKNNREARPLHKQ